ncbi:Ribonuclease HI (EC 3.1.26.4) [uncultured Gammaproteobacteria bacterium]|jgi:ribonuclease HI|nr:Ribonuclease HI (EC [Bathymodiolus brooksi thiotrophic gill symbiont]CAC9558690.1 Ribonuclease HI (EC 3.1.26.4) [uncultured Gammaproteobacteria bacterium]CAB9544320.1 Ribonuclease HI (EC [Bathymodiolus brooksi thiotrophic gill symbiont]CAC9568431.1 Ribonuclease HI (EC 3.1.26.4) [uncultured Gammaproteobacteria bacterium]CAC9585588.1 Ribonuclease HI (EC 3.1.26.4) [uncultured Gammaproteobacteria bacterium]
MNKIIIYTDGGCRGNPGIGGWGVWLRYGKREKKLNGSEKDTTNNRMELMAAIKALEAIKSANIAIDLYTDSKYVMNGITQWIVGWKQKNWKTAAKKPVKNADLWQQLDKLNQKYQINWCWVKGHSGDKGNDMADLLANQAMDNINLS